MKIHISFSAAENHFVRLIVRFVASLFPHIRVKKKDGGANRRHVYLVSE